MPIPPAALEECLRSVGAFVEKRRPPPHIRDKLDINANITGSEVILAEVRPRFDDPTQIREGPFARAKWIGTQCVWRLDWLRGNLKWHRYDPMPEAGTMAEVLAEVDRDRHGCFFG